MKKIELDSTKLEHVLVSKSQKIVKHIMDKSLKGEEKFYYMLRILKESIIICSDIAYCIVPVIEKHISDVTRKDPNLGYKLLVEYDKVVNERKNLENRIHQILLEPEFYNMPVEEAKEMTMESFDFMIRMHGRNSDDPKEYYLRMIQFFKEKLKEEREKEGQDDR